MSDDDRIALAQTYFNSDRTERADGTPTFDVRANEAAQFTVTSTSVHGDVVYYMTSPFLGIFNQANLEVRVSSAARRRYGAPVCVLGLDPTEEATMDFNGRASLEVDNCATQANSISGAGLHQAGSPSMKAQEIGVTGGYVGTDYSPPPITSTIPLADPYASLPVPQTGPCHPLSGAKLQQQTITLSPGTYCGGLDIKASSVVTLEPGIYVFKDGPLTIDSQSQVEGREVLLAFLGNSSTLSLIGGGSLTVTSPTSGTYANIQFFGDRSTYAVPGENGANGNNLWFAVIGDSHLTYDGVLYAPSFHVWMAGGSIIEGKSPNYLAIAKKLWFQDNTHVHFTQINTRGLEVTASANLDYGSVLIK
jgi:hypothetical protein